MLRSRRAGSNARRRLPASLVIQVVASASGGCADPLAAGGSGTWSFGSMARAARAAATTGSAGVATGEEVSWDVIAHPPLRDARRVPPSKDSDPVRNAGCGGSVAMAATQRGCGGPCFTSPPPPGIHDRHRAVCFARLSAGLRTSGREAWPRLLPLLPRPVAQCIDAGSFPVTAAGQCRIRLAAHRTSLLIRWPWATGTDRHNIVWTHATGQPDLVEMRHGAPHRSGSAKLPRMTIQPSRDATASLLVLASVFHFLLAAVAVQFLRPGYDPWQAPLSLYLSGEWGAWLRCAYYGLALGVAVLAVQVHRSLLPAPQRVLVPGLLVIGAAALAVTAMWPGPAPGYPVDELGVLVHRLSAMSA